MVGFNLNKQHNNTTKRTRQAVAGKRKSQEFDQRQAIQLADSLRRTRKVTRTIKLPMWADEFRKLREYSGLSEEKITTVLNWYCENIGGQYVPEAFSAKSFREKFIAIESAMGKNFRPLAKVEVTPQARKVAQRLADHCTWPKGCVADLPAVCQISLDNIIKFRRKLVQTKSRLWEKILEENRIVRKQKGRENIAPCHSFVYKFIHWLDVHEFFNHPEEFVFEWFELASKRIADWQSWAGDLQGMVFKEEADWFQLVGKDLAVRFGGNMAYVVWNELMTEINHED